MNFNMIIIANSLQQGLQDLKKTRAFSALVVEIKSDNSTFLAARYMRRNPCHRRHRHDR